MKKIYIAGQITGVKDFRDKFIATEDHLKKNYSYIILNPARLPAGLSYEEYMHIDFAMISVSDAIYMMPCYKNSPGAQRELRFARSLEKEIIFGGYLPCG